MSLGVLKTALVAALLLIRMPSALAAEYLGPMRFFLGRTCAEESCKRCIVAEGGIASKTAETFVAFLKEERPERMPLCFDSPGGNLQGALQLGVVIRRLGLETYVGTAYQRDHASDPARRVLSVNFGCLSACVYAYAGGVRRSADAAAKFGVHAPYNRFSDSDRYTETGERRQREAYAVLERYLDAMGVSRKLIEYGEGMARTALRVLTLDEAMALDLVNAELK